MTRISLARRSSTDSVIFALVAAWFTANAAVGQVACVPPSEGIHAGGIEFRFATADQGRALLTQEDVFIQNLSPFDRQVRMHTESDPGKDTFLRFVAGEVIEWPEQDCVAIRKALELLDKPLSGLDLPIDGPVLLVHTTGREESGAAYTRGSAIVLPQGKTGSPKKPPQRLIAHELFHVLSRTDRECRDQLYSIIGFQPTGEISLPKNISDRRITNPDAPQISHAIRVRLGDGQSVMLAPVLLAKSGFDPNQPSLFHYIDFRLMEVRQDAGNLWVPETVEGEAILHDPSIPDFHRQIGGNTGYIIHPDEILADNFAILVTGAKAKDTWIIDAMRGVLNADPKAAD